MKNQSFLANNSIVKPPLYECEIWYQSTSLKTLKYWLRILPFKEKVQKALPCKKRRFTLLSSPLGNKTSKDQYEEIIYCGYICLRSLNPGKILGFVDLIRRPTGVRVKIRVGVGVGR
ncbi:unnamed protein product [Discosporangium mesarthrocarpum]